SLLVLYFFLPFLGALLTRRQMLEVVGASMVAGTALPLLADALRHAGVVAFAPGVVLGWGVLSIGLLCLFGLANPGGEVRLYFVLPVPAVAFVWGSLAVAALLLLAAFATGAPLAGPLEHVGVWTGTY